VGYSLNSERGTQLKNYLVQYVASASGNGTSNTNATAAPRLEYECRAGEYTTELLSIDPPIIYINNFLSDDEARDLIRLG
jgi:hypothetical protein